MRTILVAIVFAVAVPVHAEEQQAEPSPVKARLRIAGWSAAALAVVAGGAAFYFSAEVEDDEDRAQRLARENPDTLPASLSSNPCASTHPGVQDACDDGNRHELYANVSLGVGVGIAAAAGVLLYYGYRDEPAQPRVTVAPTLGGAVATVRF